MGKRFAETLQSLLDKKMITPIEFSQEIGISAVMAYNYLNETSVPKKDKLSIIAEFFSCDEHELLAAVYEDKKEKRLKRKGL